MAFKLKSYKPLPKRTVELWGEIVDNIGPLREWPPKIRNLFFQENIRHSDRFKVAIFAFVNGLDPALLLEWADCMSLCRDQSARRELVQLLTTFLTDPHKYNRMYGFNVYFNRYEYVDGEVKFNLPRGQLHPW